MLLAELEIMLEDSLERNPPLAGSRPSDIRISVR